MAPHYPRHALDQHTDFKKTAERQRNYTELYRVDARNAPVAGEPAPELTAIGERLGELVAMADEFRERVERLAGRLGLDDPRGESASAATPAPPWGTVQHLNRMAADLGGVLREIGHHLSRLERL